MDFAGRYTIPAPPETVWAAINDPDVLKTCIPGCQSLTKTDPTHFEAAVMLKIGPVRATFKGKVALEELVPYRRCVLKGEGQGGVAGFARGQAEVLLAPEDGGTALSYNAKATVGGKLAQIGQRLIDGAAKQIADEFFEKFAAAIAGPETGAPAETTEADAPPPPSRPVTAGPREGLAPEIWVVGLIGVIVILLILFGVAL
jgi:carbon monoxide dehydrogenase subunit G